MTLVYSVRSEDNICSFCASVIPHIAYIVSVRTGTVIVSHKECLEELSDILRFELKEIDGSIRY